MGMTKEEFMARIKQDRIKKESKKINEKYRKRIEEKYNKISIGDRYKIERINKEKRRKKQIFEV